jgi:PAS domain S-box-containing protein
MTETKLPADELIDSLQESETYSVKVLDMDAVILSFNKSGYKHMEVDDPKTILGRNWLSYWKDEADTKAKAAFEKARKGRIGYFEGQRMTEKGTPKWWEVTVVPLKNDVHDVQWILVMSRDVTELHALRKELATLKAK